MCTRCGCGSQGATLRNLETGAKTTLDSAPASEIANLSGEHEHLHDPGDGLHGHTHDLAPGHTHDHAHDHHHHHERHTHRHGDDDQEETANNAKRRDPHGPAGGSSEVLHLEARILARNDSLADRNRAWFAGREILALNLLSSPGAGKTTLLERTIKTLTGELPLFVIEGDQATTRDGERIRRAGAPAVQVNTGTGCHLDAEMVARGLAELKPVTGAVVMIENVGNLVCPALFDLGERAKVVLFSATEGEDKPLKYPHMFRNAALVIINKTDLLPHLEFSIAQAIANVRSINPDVVTLQISARTGQGLEAWYDWIRVQVTQVRQSAFA